MEKTVKILNCSGDTKKTIEKIDASHLLSLDTKNLKRVSVSRKNLRSTKARR